MAFRRVLIACIAIVGALSPAKAQAGDIESEVMAKINAVRGSGLAVHSGLLNAARSHSMQMASRGLNHDGADERVNSAAPDPAEGNGAPDDGFPVASWCENVTYVNYGSEGDAASNIFKQWRNSGAHNACMTNANKNVGAVGVYWDGSTWWATFIAEVDRTPPGGGGGGNKGGAQTTDVTSPSQPTKVSPQQPSGVSAPKPTPAPAAPAPVYQAPQYSSSDTTGSTDVSPSPSPTARPHKRINAPADVLLPQSAAASDETKLPDFGMQELAGVIAALLFGCLLLERRLDVSGDPPPRSALDDHEMFRPRPSMELERAGHP